MILSFDFHQVEAAWKLGDWHKLREFLPSGTDAGQSWGASVGRLLQMAKDKQVESFRAKMNQLKTVRVI